MSQFVFQARFSITGVTEITPNVEWEVSGNVLDTSPTGFTAGNAAIGDLVFTESPLDAVVNRWRILSISSAVGVALVCRVVFDELGAIAGLDGAPTPCEGVVCTKTTNYSFSQPPSIGWSLVPETIKSAIYLTDLQRLDARLNIIAAGSQGTQGPQGPSNGSGLSSYPAAKVGGGFLGPLYVIASGLGIEYNKPSAGLFTINIPAGVEISSAKINLAIADLSISNTFVDNVSFALELKIRYLDGLRNTTSDNLSFPTITVIDKSALVLGGPQSAEPFQYKPIGNSLSIRVYSVGNVGGVGEAVFRIQQLNYDYSTLVLNF